MGTSKEIKLNNFNQYGNTTMTKLDAKDIKLAQTLAKGFKAGIKNKAMLTPVIDSALRAYINEKSIADRDFILAFWDALNEDKPSEASARTIINRNSKRINKENGNENAPALTVKNGELVEVVPRGSKGGNGGGDGEGSSFTAIETPKSIEIRGNVAILSAHLETINDVAIRAALKQAIAELAAKL